MIAPSWYPTDRQLRQFALISLVGFPLIGLVFSRFHVDARLFKVMAGVGVVVALVGLVSPKTIRPLYALLIAITMPIGWVISNVLLRVIFYLLFTPLGLIFRLIGRDPLVIRRPAGDSYWRDVRATPDLASYYRQA